MDPDKPDLVEMRECLERSGYLLESRIVRNLVDIGLFVEPNQVILDPRTGKSRELDVVAQAWRYDPEHPGVCVSSHFVLEVLNNPYPLILLTERPSTPNEDFESYVKYIETPDPSPFATRIDVLTERTPDRRLLFAQYCGLTPKKGGERQLMASHPTIRTAHCRSSPSSQRIS